MREKDVELAVARFLAAEKPFTGWNVTQDLRKGSGKFAHQEVTRFVRTLFNTGRMPGWASTLVNGDGPVLYFKIPRAVSRTAAKIRKAMETATAGPLADLPRHGSARAIEENKNLIIVE